MRKSALLLVAASAAAAVAVAVLDAHADSPSQQASKAALARHEALKPVSAFDGIKDKSARSQALFLEAGKVLAHPRCANCHPADRPAQADDRHPHVPMVSRSQQAHSGAAMTCQTCHTSKNVWVGGDPIVSVPGNPAWALAPPEMQWQGKTLGEVCQQLKDPNRNGGRTLAEIHEHMAHDELVAWGWSPGPGRTPAPGTQAEAAALIQAWIDTGAKCPTSGPKIPGPST